VAALGAGGGPLGGAPARAQTGTAGDGPPAAVTASFTPLRLGAPTTVAFALQIEPAGAAVPAPLSAMEISYPIDLGLATSGLGLRPCNPAALEAQGPRACPADSKIGQGGALVEVPFGPEAVSERVSLGIYAAPSTDGFLHLAIVAQGGEPVLARVVLGGVLLPGRLQLTVPPIASLPAAPYASIVSMHATLGGALTYYERVHGRVVAYRPRGIGLPARCPRGGWRVAARLDFADASVSRAQTAVACPR
jgi:hypothetical protein